MLKCRLQAKSVLAVEVVIDLYIGVETMCRYQRSAPGRECLPGPASPGPGWDWIPGLNSMNPGAGRDPGT